MYAFTIVPTYPRVLTRNQMTLDSSRVVTDQALADGDLDPETGNALRIPCNPTFDIPQPPMIPPTDLDRCGCPLNDRQGSKDLKLPNSSASHPGSSTCHCKRRNALCISCITSHDIGPSSHKMVTWMTDTSSIMHGNWG